MCLIRLPLSITVDLAERSPVMREGILSIKDMTDFLSFYGR